MSTAPTARPKVLVVDDDLSLRVLTTIVLARVGYSPTAVSGVARALERVAEGGVDVVLTDLAMPGLDGFDLLTALRASRMSPPVVVMTASDDEEQIIRALGLGARTVVRKPFTGEELGVALEIALGAVRAAA
jgi:DNA-binding response OmpR family regulator